MKRHMRRVIGLQDSVIKELLTVINRIEAILNSKPLVPLSSDPTDPTALTPAHFLIGDTMLSLPQEDIEKLSIMFRYKLTQKLQSDFWKSWRRGYLTILQFGNKWSDDGPKMRIGDLVLLVDNNEAPCNGKLEESLMSIQAMTTLSGFAR